MERSVVSIPEQIFSIVPAHVEFLTGGEDCTDALPCENLLHLLFALFRRECGCSENITHRRSP